MRLFDDSSGRTSPPLSIERRRILQLAGGTTAGIAVLSGTASAHKSQFYGCSQVCSGTKNNVAVVKTKAGDYECRWMDRKSNRRNQDWGGDQWCYEISGNDVAIVGMIERDRDPHDDPSATWMCNLCLNPNNCASNYYDDEEEVLDAVKNDTACRCDRFHDGSCDVWGSSGGTGGNNGRGNGNDGRGNGGNGNGGGNGGR